jgi:cobalt/nickel transport system permease protein
MRRHRGVILIGLLIASVVAVSSAWLASPEPDGLERVAEDQAFNERAKDPGYEVLPGYTVPGIDGTFSTALAGVIGVGLVAGLTLGLGYLLRRRHGGPTPPGTAGER